MLERNGGHTPDGIVFRESRDGTVTGLHVDGTAERAGALVISRSSGFNVTDSQILDPAGPGLILDDVSDSRVSGCRIRAQVAVKVRGGRGNQIVDNLIVGRQEIAAGTATVGSGR